MLNRTSLRKGQIRTNIADLLQHDATMSDAILDYLRAKACANIAV